VLLCILACFFLMNCVVVVCLLNGIFGYFIRCQCVVYLLVSLECVVLLCILLYYIRNV